MHDDLYISYVLSYWIYLCIIMGTKGALGALVLGSTVVPCYVLICSIMYY